MKSIITDNQKDPLGRMLLDYLKGDKSVYADVRSPDLSMWRMTGKIMFRSFKEMSHLEKKALGLCRGRILDVGAGSGCHSLYLQKRQLNVAAIDISPGCVAVMKKRHIPSPIHGNLFLLNEEKYDTLLMLMNGIGICGSIDGLNLFFQFLPHILSDSGQVIFDSTDLAALYDIAPASYGDAYYGETQFTMFYGPIKSDPFDWLYIDYETLRSMAEFHRFKCELIMTDRSHRYLARSTMP